MTSVGVKHEPRWYLARLRAMSPAEVGWRTTTGLRQLVLQPRVEQRTLDLRDGPWPQLLRRLVAGAPPASVDDARRIAAGELSFWGRTARVDPRSLPWHDGPFADRAAAGESWAQDPKCRLELDRQQHLWALAAGGDPSFRRLSIDQVGDWIACHPGHDSGWRSGYECAHRIVTWAWALPLAADAASGVELAAIEQAFLRSAGAIRRNPSRYSSANNHRLAELAGLLAFETLTRDRRRWSSVWRSFESELLRQTYGDGGSREQACGYFLYVLEIVWTATLLAHAVGRELGRVGERAESMLDWLRAVADGAGEPPAFGDDAEDRFVRLEYFERRRAGVLAARVRSVLDGTPTLAPPQLASDNVASRALRESGYVVLRSSSARIVLDTGELGLGAVAAHGHADALALTVDVDGVTLLRDSGTGTYAAEAGRDTFRVTSAHNSITIDDESQAEPTGPHLWGRRFSSRIEHVTLGENVDYVRASHDGYYARAAHAVHTRSVTFFKPVLLIVLDRVAAERACLATLTWQTMPGVELDDLCVTVAASPDASRHVEPGPFSERFTWIHEAPRTVFCAEGSDLVFATAIPIARRRPVELAVRHGTTETTVDVANDPPLRIVERWTGGAATVERA